MAPSSSKALLDNGRSTPGFSGPTRAGRSGFITDYGSHCLAAGVDGEFGIPKATYLPSSKTFGHQGPVDCARDPGRFAAAEMPLKTRVFAPSARSQFHTITRSICNV